MNANIHIPDDLQDVMAEMVGIAFSARNPRTGKAIQFSLSHGEHTYIYFRGKGGNDYCYTPHHDTDGWYYSFAYIGKGKGAKSGSAKRFTMKHLACHRTRKAAYKRALKLKDKE